MTRPEDNTTKPNYPPYAILVHIWRQANGLMRLYCSQLLERASSGLARAEGGSEC